MRESRDIRSIKVKSLILDLKNPRHDKSSSQSQSLKYLCTDKKSHLDKLAKSILKHGLNPTDLPIVYKKGSKYVVKEGNRRLATLILLNNPDKAPNLKLKKIFQKLSNNNKSKIPKSISCVIYKNADDNGSKHWIKMKHAPSDGEGVLKWDPERKKKYIKPKNKSTLLFEYADKNKISRKKIDESNLSRLMSTPYVREKIGLNFSKNKIIFTKSESIVKANMKKIFNEMPKKKFKVGVIYTADLRKSWIDGVIKDGRNMTHGTAGSKDISKSTNRNNLIPKNFTLRIKPKKINNIYHELKNYLYIGSNSDKSVPNAVGVLFRVFLEISIDEYMKKHVIQCSPKNRDRYDNCSIENKIEVVCNHMIKNEYARDSDLRSIRITSNAKKTDILHIQRFHEYVHSTVISPESDGLKAKWDNIEGFFEILWNNIK